MNALSATPNPHIKAELRQHKIPRVSRIHSTILHPLYYPTLRIMSQHTVTITGVPGIWEGSGLQGSQPPPPRREISDLIKDEKQFSLYVQALRKTCSTSRDLSCSHTAEQMFSTPQTDPVSHFQLSGIHGLPYNVEWDGSRPPSIDGYGGYCAHGNTLFPTFHRIYVLAYEVRRISIYIYP